MLNTLNQNEINSLLNNNHCDNYQNTQVPISVILGRTDITIEEFLNLKKGDVIWLKQKRTNKLEIMVGNFLKFLGLFGIKKSRIVVKISEVLVKGDYCYEYSNTKSYNKEGRIF